MFCLCACDKTIDSKDLETPINMIMTSPYTKYTKETLSTYFDGSALNDQLKSYMPYIGYSDKGLYLPEFSEESIPEIDIQDITIDGSKGEANVMFGETQCTVAFTLHNNKIASYSKIYTY
jgi:hypothetical protein